MGPPMGLRHIKCQFLERIFYGFMNWNCNIQIIIFFVRFPNFWEKPLCFQVFPVTIWFVASLHTYVSLFLFNLVFKAKRNWTSSRKRMMDDKCVFEMSYLLSNRVPCKFVTVIVLRELIEKENFNLIIFIRFSFLITSYLTCCCGN